MILKLKILVFGLLCSSLLLQAQPANRKIALLIGVGKYPTSGGWPSLSSANDLKLMKDALINQGFPAENINMVADDQATKANIIDAIQTKLIKGVKPGDIVYFHFSGHGQQKEDKDGDEIDGYDECIVPYDSPKKYEAGINEGEKLISDDELHDLFEILRSKLGPTGQLIVALDACHSGTGTRGAAVGRGTTEPMASPEYVKKNGQNKMHKENNEINNKQESASITSKLAPMIAFFGSAQNQINYEMTNDQGLQYGSLTYSLSKYLVQLTKDESYRGLFDKIKVEMGSIAPLQQPQAEGDLDIEVLNGKALGAANYFKVISAADDEKIVINSGFLQGVNDGTTIGFFKSDTRDIENTKPIVTGKISKSMATSSYVSLDSTIEPGLIKDSWVYVLERSMGDIKVTLKIGVSDPDLLGKLKSKLFSFPFIVDDPAKAVLIIEQKKDENGKEFIYLNTYDNFTLDSFPASNNNMVTVTKLSRRIVKYLQGQSIRKLEMESEDLKLSFQIIPYKMNSQDIKIDSLIPLKEDETGTRKIKVGDSFKIVIQNDGSKPAYFNLIDISPNNVYVILLPWENETPEEMRILPGQKKLMPSIYGVGEPLGYELFKLIASSKPLDLRSAYGTRGNTSKNPFEKLISEFENAEFYSTRGSKPLPLGNMDINIYSESFIIVK